MNETPEKTTLSRPHMKRMTRAAFLVALVLFLAVLLVGGWLLHYAQTPGPTLAEKVVTVYIPRGTSMAGIADVLAEKKLITDARRFLILHKLMGGGALFQAGEFALHSGQKPLDLARELLSAPPLGYNITIPEGYTNAEIASLLAKDGWVNRQRFLDLVSDSSFISSLGFGEINSLEGYLFPDTYQLIKPAGDERKIIRLLVDRSLGIWRRLSPGASKMSRQEIFTLASIIEKETAAPEERPLIAGVFMNRLKKKMRLQSDPTVRYGLPNVSGPLSRADLQHPTPYNTYVIHGLPPGPICNPGEAALSAALFPAKTDYLYFVSKNDGTHTFSRSLREHNRAVRAYRARKKRGHDS